MTRIVHIAVKVDDVARLSKLYRQVFGFVHTGTIVAPPTTSDRQMVASGHTAHHLNDGATDFTLLHFDDDDYAEPGSCGSQRLGIHHFGIEDADPAAAAERIRVHGGEVLSEPGLLPVKFRAPGGIIAEVIPEARFSVKRITQAAKAALQLAKERGRILPDDSMARLEIHEGPIRRGEHAPRITDVVLKVDDCEKVARFFQDVFGFKTVISHPDSNQRSVRLTDGTLNLAIVQFHDDQTSVAKCAGEKPCIHHFRLDVAATQMEPLVAGLREFGCEFIAATARNVIYKIPAEGAVGELAAAAA